MNGNITICSSDIDLDIKYGMFDLGEERECARASFKYILNDFRDIKQLYFRLGFHLHEFKMLEYYKDFGYLSFEEFCEANIDMDKGAISRCINVFLMTNSAGELTYNAGVKKTGCASYMSDKYKDYSYSQLTEMLPLDEEMRKHVTPDMTVKRIRELKNSILDINAPDIFRVFEYLDIKPFTRENVLEQFTAWGKSYRGYGCPDGISFDFYPGKLSICHSKPYTFNKILDFYISCGGRFEEGKVATSQPDGVRLCVNDLVTKKGIVLQNHIRRCQAIKKDIIEIYDNTGKLINRYECDLLMSGNYGSGLGKMYYRVIS